MPPVMHRDEAILMLWINICEAYCHYLHNTTTRNRDCWLGKLRRETAQCWWRRRVESVWWSHSWEPRIKWRGGFLPRDVTTFAFIQRRLFPTISWVAEQDHLPHDNLTVSITLNNFNSECFGRKVKSFWRPCLQVCMVSPYLWLWGSACWWTIQRMMAKWRLLFRFQEHSRAGQESPQATQCANKQS